MGGPIKSVFAAEKLAFYLPLDKRSFGGFANVKGKEGDKVRVANKKSSGMLVSWLAQCEFSLSLSVCDQIFLCRPEISFCFAIHISLPQKKGKFAQSIIKPKGFVCCRSLAFQRATVSSITLLQIALLTEMNKPIILLDD